MKQNHFFKGDKMEIESRKTDYTLEEQNGLFEVYKNGKREAYGIIDKESALHAIHTLEGKKQDDFYICNEGKVEVTERRTING